MHQVHSCQVRRFLLECGTRLSDAAPETWRGGDPLETEALRLMEAEVCADAPSTRGAICRRGTAAVVRHGGRAEGRPRLLNRHHHRLLRARSPDDPRVCAAGAAPCRKIGPMWPDVARCGRPARPERLIGRGWAKAQGSMGRERHALALKGASGGTSQRAEV